VAVLLLLLVLSAILLIPGLPGDLFFDDIPNLYENTAVQVIDLSAEELSRLLISNMAGPLGRPLSYLSFGINHYFTGLAVVPLRATNIAIHLASGVAVYALAYLLLQAARRPGEAREVPSEGRLRAAALACTALWLYQPMALQSVLFVVQRMTSLAALFTFLGLVIALQGRLALASGAAGAKWRMWIGVGLFTPLAVLSKENGALLPFYLGLVELTLLRMAGLGAGERRFLRIFYVLTVLVPFLVMVVVFSRQWGLWLEFYEALPYSMAERSLTEARAIWFYLGMTYLPMPGFISLFHDDWQISRSLLVPPITLVAVVGLAALVAFAVWVRRRSPLLAFGIGFFLVGHTLESSFLPLEPVFDHRQYLPALGPLLPLAALTLRPLALERSHWRPAVAPWSVVVLLAAFYAGHSYLRAVEWGDTKRFVLKMAERQPQSARAQGSVGQLFAGLSDLDAFAADKEKLRDLAGVYFRKGADLAPEQPNILFPLLLLEGRRGLGLDPLVDRIVAALQRYPTPKIIRNQLKTYVDCQVAGACPPAPRNTHRIIDAILEKTSNHPKTRADFLELEANYVFLVDQDYDRAIKGLLAAIDMDPERMEPRISLISALIAAGVLDTAREELAKVREKAPRLRYEHHFKRLEADLAAAEAAQKRATKTVEGGNGGG
jgi:tetratricopeptide (TPR) repeat protein